MLASEPPGYVLRVPPAAIDLVRFRDLALGARRAAAASHARQALQLFDAALAEWRGPALGGIGPDEVVAPIVTALDEERTGVVEDRFDVLLALGLHAETVGELSVAASDHPLRERLWSTLAIALYRSQRQADALRAIEQARRTLIDELGLDPGPGLRALERRILEHDPSLLAVPVAIAPVVEEGPPAARPSGSRFVGRTEEWTRMLAALDRASGGRPSTLLIEGEPGIGKSALAERLLGHADDCGWRIAIGRCVDGELAPALWPIVELARDVDRGRGGSLAEPGPDGAPSTPVEIADAMLAAIDVSPGRWCLFVDDLHWADRLTIEVLVLMCERLRERAVLVIGAFRPVITVPGSPLHDLIGSLARVPGSERVVLPPLEEHDVAELLASASGAPPTDEAVRLVTERAGGNPFFVGELARLFGESGVRFDQTVPAAVRDVVRARLAPLPPLTKAGLQIAAVAGERLDLPVLMEVNGLDADSCVDALDPAIVSRMLVTGSDNELRFAHAIVREAVLADIAVVQRCRFHRAVADAIERVRGSGVDVIETIARHRLASLPVGDVLQTALQALEAADVARWRGAFDTSDELAQHALDLARQMPRGIEADAVEVRALESLVNNEGKRTGEPAGPEMARRIETIARSTDSDAARVLSIYVRWWRMDVEPIGNFAELADAARALAEHTQNSFARLLGYHVAGTQAFQEGRLVEAAALLDASIAAAGTDDPFQEPGYLPEIYVPAMAGIVAQLRGQDELAQLHGVSRMSAWLRGRGRVDPTASIDLHFTIALLAALRGDPTAAGRGLVGVDYLDPPVGSSFLAHGAAVFAGWAAAMADESDGLDRALAALDRLDERVPTQMLRPVFCSFVGEAMLHAGDARALAMLDRARAEARHRGELWWLPETLRLSADAERRFGDPDRAEAYLVEARALADLQGSTLLATRLAGGS